MNSDDESPALMTAENARARLKYDASSGYMTWTTHKRRTMLGTQAKSLDAAGYVQVCIKGKQFKGHRLAWLIYHGEWPAGDIDHINGIRTDNRIENLRVVTNAINCQNKRKALPSSKTGILGVVKVGERFHSSIYTNRKKTFLGSFDSAEQAHAAYIAAKRQLHVGCTL